MHLPAPRTWPVLLAALLYGLVEWAALSRGRLTAGVHPRMKRRR